MQISITNFRGIKDANFELGRITIIGGENGAGKTSIAQAIGSALTGECPVRDLKKQDYKHLVKIGKPAANIEVKTGSGRAVMQFPEGKGYTEGISPTTSIYASGLASPLEMKKSEAAECWISLLQAEPTLDDLKLELKDFANAEEIVQLVKAKSWDGALAFVKEEGAKHKGRWERVTGERYGTAKAEGWTPNGFTAISDKSALEANLNAKAEAYKESLKKNAVSEHDRAGLAAKADLVKEKKAERDKAAESSSRANEELIKAEKALKDFDAFANILKCPHCGKPVRLDSGKLAKAAENSLPDESKRKELKNNLDIARISVNDAGRKIVECDMAISEAREAQEQLNKCVVAEPNKAAELELQAAKDALAACNNYHEAKSENAEIMWRIEAAKILAPEGLRKRFLEMKLQEFNKILQCLCEVSEWASVKIEPDLSVSFEDKLFAILSESEQYRTRCTIQAALAILQNSELLIFDRADLLTKKGRNGLYNLCAYVEEASVARSIIFLSANKPEEIPHLENSEKSYWIKNGTIENV
jgi:DNA repair exonuclease SbcCD ATPase subunit